MKLPLIVNRFIFWLRRAKNRQAIIAMFVCLALLFASVRTKLFISPSHFSLFYSALLLHSTESTDVVNTASPTNPPTISTPMVYEETIVTQVVDGDTIQLNTNKKVRYIGIDTPETKDPNAPIECYGKEASDLNTQLVLGKTVKLEKDVSETDRYGRQLRYIWVGDIFVNEYLVREGYARSSTYPPDVKYQELFQKAEREAREAKKGLWGSVCDTWTTLTPTDYLPKPTPAPYNSSPAVINPTSRQRAYICFGRIISKNSRASSLFSLSRALHKEYTGNMNVA